MTGLVVAVTVLSFVTFLLGVAVWWLYGLATGLCDRLAALEAATGLALLPPGTEAALAEQLEVEAAGRSLTQWDPPSKPGRKTTTGDEY